MTYLKYFVIGWIGWIVQSEHPAFADPRVRDIGINVGRFTLEHNANRQRFVGADSLVDILPPFEMIQFHVERLDLTRFAVTATCTASVGTSTVCTSNSFFSSSSYSSRCCSATGSVLGDRSRRRILRTRFAIDSAFDHTRNDVLQRLQFLAFGNRRRLIGVFRIGFGRRPDEQFTKSREVFTAFVVAGHFRFTVRAIDCRSSTSSVGHSFSGFGARTGPCAAGPVLRFGAVGATSFLFG